MAFLLSSCLLVAVSAFGGTRQAVVTAPAPAAAVLQADDITVYTLVFQTFVLQGKRLPVLLADHTSIGVPPGMLVLTPLQDPKSGQFLAKISAEARLDYREKNKLPVALSSPCSFAAECTAMDVVRLTGMVMPKEKNDKGWDKFFERYPGAPGIFVISRPGFNVDHTEAILYVGKSCGTLCGEGTYFWLTKHDGVWMIQGHTSVWIA